MKNMFERFLFWVGFHLQSGKSYYDCRNNEGDYKQ